MSVPLLQGLVIIAETSGRHEYSLILAIAAKVPAKILDTIQAAGDDYNILIEEDSTVSINNS